MTFYSTLLARISTAMKNPESVGCQFTLSNQSYVSFVWLHIDELIILDVMQLLSVISLLSSDRPNTDSPANVDAAKEVRDNWDGAFPVTRYREPNCDAKRLLLPLSLQEESSSPGAEERRGGIRLTQSYRVTFTSFPPAGLCISRRSRFILRSATYNETFLSFIALVLTI